MTKNIFYGIIIFISLVLLVWFQLKDPNMSSKMSNLISPANAKNIDIIPTNLKAFLENLSSTDLINNWLTIAMKKPAKIIKQLKTLNPFAETKTSILYFG